MKNLLLFAIGLTLFTITCAGQESPFVKHQPDEGPIVVEVEDSPETTPAEEAGDLINWENEYDAGSIEKAYIDKKLIMLYFYADGSEQCEKQTEVFADPMVAAIINKHFVSYKIDVRDMPPAGRVELEVSKVPVIFFLFPQAKKEDSLVKAFYGYKDRDEMLKNVAVALVLKKKTDAENEGN